MPYWRGLEVESYVLESIPEISGVKETSLVLGWNTINNSREIVFNT